jgi:hypothetical protein
MDHRHGQKAIFQLTNIKREVLLLLKLCNATQSFVLDRARPSPPNHKCSRQSRLMLVDHAQPVVRRTARIHETNSSAA